MRNGEIEKLKFSRSKMHSLVYFCKIRSRAHNIYTEKINKVTLSCEDDKRIILEDGVHTLVLGHFKSK